MKPGDRSQPNRPNPPQKKPIPPRVRNEPGRGWTLVPPHCANELEPDLEDAEMLLKEGDAESARDAVLYLLEECQELLAGHELLGRIAEREPVDLAVAQGHYGYVFELTLKWLGPLDLAPMDKSRRINRTALACAEGLCRVLEKRGQRAKASQVRQHVDAWSGVAGSGRAHVGPRPSGPSGPRPRPSSGPKRRPMMPRPDRPKPVEGNGEGA